MLRALVRQFGAPRQVIKLEDADRQPLGPGEVEIKVIRAAINPSDLIPVLGAYASRTKLPFVPGFECVGRITKCAPDVRALHLGQRVIPIGVGGTWQELLNAASHRCFSVPDDFDDEEAAFAYINPMTAHRLIAALEQHFGDPKEKRVCISAAGSAIGRMLLNLLSRKGFRPIALVRSSAAAARLAEDFSGDIVVKPSFPYVDAVLDAVGGGVGNELLRHVEVGGAFIQYGALSGAQIDPGLIWARKREVTFSLMWLRSWVSSAPQEEIGSMLVQSFENIRTGHARTRLQGVFPLSDLDQALAKQQDPGRWGKLLLAP
jgi:NADPH:quinone reductase-like Zn-dependent oxidoreductase